MSTGALKENRMNFMMADPLRFIQRTEMMIVLAGAGISRAAGLLPYRDPGKDQKKTMQGSEHGISQKERDDRIFLPELGRYRVRLHNDFFWMPLDDAALEVFYQDMGLLAEELEYTNPTKMHELLVFWLRTRKKFFVVTQNVDDLELKALATVIRDFRKDKAHYIQNCLFKGEEGIDQTNFEDYILKLTDRICQSHGSMRDLFCASCASLFPFTSYHFLQMIHRKKPSNCPNCYIDNQLSARARKPRGNSPLLPAVEMFDERRSSLESHLHTRKEDFFRDKLQVYERGYYIKQHEKKVTQKVATLLIVGTSLNAQVQDTRKLLVEIMRRVDYVIVVDPTEVPGNIVRDMLIENNLDHRVKILTVKAGSEDFATWLLAHYLPSSYVRNVK